MPQRISICRRFTFDSAHRLPRHAGKCKRPHGHTYCLEVEVSGYVAEGQHSSQGMVVDFAELKAAVNAAVLNRFDHQDLNAVLSKVDDTDGLLRSFIAGKDPEVDNITTAENLVVLFANLIKAVLPGWVTLERVRLSETPDSWAEWRAPGIRMDA